MPPLFGPGNGRGGLGEWGDPAREWTQSAPMGPPCVPTQCDPRTGLPIDPQTGRPLGFAGDPGFDALLRIMGGMSSAIAQLANPTGGAQVFQPPPHISPPFRARPLTGIARAVLNTATAGPGIGSVAAAALAVAEGLPGAPLALLPATPGAAGIGGPQLLVNFTSPQGYRTVLSHVGVEISDGDTDSVLFTVVIGAGPAQVGNRMSGGVPLFDPSPLALISTLTDPSPMSANVPENTTVQIWAGNLDPNFGVLVSGALFGWVYPALQQADSLASSLSQAPCAPSGTERLDCRPCGPGGYDGYGG